VCLTALAKEKRTRTMQPLDENIPARTSFAETLDIKEQVSVILASMSAEDRFLLTGREVLDLSYEELAQISGKNAGALRTRLSRLKDQIRRNLKDQESFFP
jgi:DNA-directed RNA polymerase specialized sigma24 family protein